MFGSGLEPHPLPLVVGHNNRVRTLTFTPTVALGDRWAIYDLQFQREKMVKADSFGWGVSKTLSI